MKVLLHGATNLSNYGDYLFAEIYKQALESKGHKVEFYSAPKYGISDFFAKHLGYQPDRRHFLRTIKQCDALVYIGGGYFVEGNNKRLYSEITRVMRYFVPAYYFIRSNKPIFISGVGAGPFEDGIYSKMARKVMNTATSITVRNAESLEYCKQYSIKNDIRVTADSALVIPSFLNEKQNRGWKPSIELPHEKKIIVLHIDGNQYVKEKIYEVIKQPLISFVQKEKYILYLVADGIKSTELYKEYSDAFKSCMPHVLIYEDPWDLTYLIKNADMVITTKLHVGIVASSFGVSVLSYPFVSNKTKRFYHQIGEDGRCVDLVNVTSDDVRRMLNKYKDEKINVPDEIKQLAKSNFDILP